MVANHSGRPIAQRVLDEIMQSPIRGALRQEDIEVLNEVHGGLSANEAMQRLLANLSARGYDTNEAMLQQLQTLVGRIRN
jgi:hypothetical protein